MDNERLQPELCGAAIDRRRARRPFRPPAHLRRRPRPVRGGIGRLRAREERGLFDCSACRPGSGSGACDATRHGTLERGIPAARARQGAGRLQRLDGACPHRRSGGGRAVAESIAWQWIFWINIPIGLIAIPLVRSRIPESFGPGTALDIPGVALVTGAALGVVWGLMRGNTAGWTSPEVAAALVAGFLLAIAFVAWELRAGAPMLPMRLFRSRAFSSGNAASFLYSASLYGTVFFMAQFLQTALGHGPVGAGLRLLPWTATLFVVAPIAGALVNRIGERSLIVFGLVLQAVGMAWIAMVAAPDLAYATLVAPLIVAGAGVSMAMPAAQNAVLSSVAQTEIGKASGTFNMLRFLGGVSGIAIAVAVFAGSGSFSSPQTFSAGFVAAIGVAAVLSLLGAVAGMWQPARRAAALAQVRAITSGKSDDTEAALMLR